MALHLYLLGEVDFEELLSLQRRMVFDVSGERDRAVLLVCEHPPVISVGRHGSRADIQYDECELELKGWPVRWVNRGGGCLLHVPGQLAIYPILPLDRLQLKVPAYLAALRNVMLDVAIDCNARGATVVPGGVAVDGRCLASVGVAVRDWVTYFGAVLNVNPGLDPFRKVSNAFGVGPMTSLERERRMTINPLLVRQRIVERFMERFGMKSIEIFHDHPELPTRQPTPHPPRGPDGAALAFRIGSDVIEP